MGKGYLARAGGRSVGNGLGKGSGAKAQRYGAWSWCKSNGAWAPGKGNGAKIMRKIMGLGYGAEVWSMGQGYGARA